MTEIKTEKVDVKSLKTGDCITISPNKTTSDRSFTNYVLTVIAINDGHIQVSSKRHQSIILVVSEHDFFMANHFKGDG